MVDLSRTEYPCSAVLLMWISIRRVSTGFIGSSRPSSSRSGVALRCSGHRRLAPIDCTASLNWPAWTRDAAVCPTAPVPADRSEEHTADLQSLRHLVCRLLLEK